MAKQEMSDNHKNLPWQDLKKFFARLALVLKTFFFHKCVILYTCSQSNSGGSVLNRAIRVRLATSVWYDTLMKNCFKYWSQSSSLPKRPKTQIRNLISWVCLTVTDLEFTTIDIQCIQFLHTKVIPIRKWVRSVSTTITRTVDLPTAPCGITTEHYLNIT